MRLGSASTAALGCALFAACRPSHSSLPGPPEAASRPALVAPRPTAGLPCPSAEAQAPSAEAKKGNELRLSLDLGSGVLFVFTVTPAEPESAQVSLEGSDAKNCPLEIGLDREWLGLERAGQALRVDPSVIKDFATADTIDVRRCGRRWSLDESQLEQVRNVVARYLEERASIEGVKPPIGAERPPPEGGWPPWHAFATLPPARTSSLWAVDVYDKIAGSLARVVGVLEHGKSYGAAVAVTPTLLVTNCQAVSGARSITVVRWDFKEFAASVVSSDVANDRCVLEVTDVKFIPVAGVRRYADLKLGERVYTYGNPGALSAGLHGGELIALRHDGRIPYLQTTAPITGSSWGGGVFDDRGNLVGITTALLNEKEHLDPSLNFAMAAEMFWVP